MRDMRQRNEKNTCRSIVVLFGLNSDSLITGLLITVSNDYLNGIELYGSGFP